MPDTAGLDTVLDFLNTLDERSFIRHGSRHTGGDAIASLAGLAAWLGDRRLVPSGAEASEADLAMGHALRDALRSALRLRAAAGSGEADAESLASLNTILGGFPLRARFGAGVTPQLVPSAADGVGAGLAAIAAAVTLSAAAGSWSRLKICASPDCGWVFYDESRNGAGRWCSMRSCGNRDKTRAYRQRHPAATRQLPS